MALWHTAGLAFFVYVLVVAALNQARRLRLGRVLAGSAIGSTVVLWSTFPGQPVLLSDWIWPAAVLLIAYWTSGLLFTAPDFRQERALICLDSRLDVREVARRTPRLLAEVFEAAYAGVYLLVPVTLLLRHQYSATPDPQGFWSVVLVTDFICFGMLPWVQTRPPRALEGKEPWHSSLRQFNVRLLGSTSIQVNTFPSGHAAEALAAALLVVEAPAVILLLVFAGAIAVSAGAVLGRYHYFADALAGWVVALGVWLAVA
jgi:membrane-associated phospholipid phosphatase